MSYQSLILTSTPTVYLELEEESGGYPTATDASGNGYDATYVGDVGNYTFRATGPLQTETSYGVTLDGTTTYIKYETLTLTDRPGYAFCLEAWVKAPSAGNGQHAVMVASSDGTQVASIRTNSSTGAWELNVDGGDGELATSGIVPGSAWQHLFARFVNPNEHYLYVDGTLAASNTTTETWSQAATDNYHLYAGARGPVGAAAAGFLNGTVSRVAYYDADVSPDRIAAHFAEGAPHYGVDGTVEYGAWLGGSVEYGALLTGSLEYGPPQ